MTIYDFYFEVKTTDIVLIWSFRAIVCKDLPFFRIIII